MSRNNTPKLNYIQRKDKTYAIWPYLIGKGMTFGTEVFAGNELKEVHWTGHEHMMFLCESENLELQKMTKHLSQYLFDNPKHAIEIKKLFTKHSKQLIRFINKINKTDLVRLHSTELILIFKEFEEIYIKCYAYGEPLPFLSKELPDKVKEIFINNYKGNNEDFEKLITDPELNFIQKEMLDMLRIKEEKADLIEIQQKIEKHKNKYLWIPFDYGAYTYDFKHFENEYSQFDIKKHQYLKTYTEDIIKEIIQLEDIYNLNKHSKTLFEAIRISSFLRNSKKELFTKLHFYFDVFFKEIARRTNLSLPIVKSIFPDELEEIMRNNQNKIEKIKKRFEYSYIITTKDSVKELIGEDAKPIFKKFYSERNPDTDTNEIKDKT